MSPQLGRGALSALAALATLVGAGCTRGGHAPLPDGSTLGGFASAGDALSYNAATLYGYMDGGADAFLEYGFSQLWVRRYARGPTQLVVELYAMRDAAAASALYSSMRRSGNEVELVAGCRGDLEAAEVRVARGNRYLVCRDENPLTQENAVVRDLCTRLLARLTGECGVGSLFTGLPSDGRVAGSEVALAGRLGLNQRAWLTPLGREGFERGSLASYTFPGGRAEVLFADYATAEAARAALAPLQKSSRPGTTGLTRERRLVLGFSESAALERLADLVARLAHAE
jgi:hypothetical protein